MLENLDNVNWTELGAPQIPELLWEIHADQPHKEKDKKHQEAWETLIELIFPQGIIELWDWGAPGRMMKNDLPHQVIPFLLEILSQTTSKSTQSIIIGNLREMAIYWEISLWVGDPGEPQYEEYVRWAARLKDVVRQGIPLYEQLLDDPYPYLDENIRKLLKEFDEV